MKITNVHGLPQTLVSAVENDPYTRGDARISVTGLLQAPRIRLLRHKYRDQIKSDVSEHIWSLLGRGVHTILERAGDEEHIAEERLYMDVKGWRVSGAIDLQKITATTCRITDWKTCSVWAVLNEKPDWQNQANLYGHLVRVVKGLEVTSLAICAIIRDWSRYKAAEDETYPQAPVAMINMPVWSHEKAQAFLEERVKLHQNAQALWDMNEEPPLCTDEDRWMRAPTWAVVKVGNKRPTKVFKVEVDAIAMVAEKGRQYGIEYRPGEPIRCKNYCQVAPWCTQYRVWKVENE